MKFEKINIKAVALWFFCFLLLIVGYYQVIWSSDFVDPCCNGLCGRCPPSFWECSFMPISYMFIFIVAISLFILGIMEQLDLKAKG